MARPTPIPKQREFGSLFSVIQMKNSVKTTRDAACSFRSFSFGVEHSCLFLSNKSLVRVLSEPSRDVNGTYEVESVCLVFHLIRDSKSPLLLSSLDILNLTLTKLRPWPHLDKTVMMWSGYVALRWGKDHASRLSVWCVVGAS